MYEYIFDVGSVRKHGRIRNLKNICQKGRINPRRTNGALIWFQFLPSKVHWILYIGSQRMVEKATAMRILWG